MKDQNTTDRLPVTLSWVILLLAGVLAVSPLIPPSPLADPGVADFSVARALDTIERIAQEPRPMGSPGNQRGRDQIVAQLHALGLELQLQAFEAPNYFSPRSEPVELVNVLGRIPGTASTRAVALVGHHDTVPGTLGANDDASAIAIMLEAARAILAGPPLLNDVILVFTDGEEPAPRFGSSTFIAEHPWARDIGFVINLEAIGSGGPSFVIEMSGPNEWGVDQYAKAVPYPAAFSFVTAMTELIGGSNTDFATFRDAGILGFDMAYLAGSSIYHTMADAPTNVSARSLHQQGANALALAQHFGNLDFASPRADAKITFFTVAGHLMMQYPAAWALPVVALTGFVLVAVGWRQREWLRIVRSIVTTLATVFLSIAAAIGVWILIGGWRSTMGIVESYLYLAGFVILATGIGAAIARLTSRRIGEGADALGGVIVWWMLSLFTALNAAGMSYLFALPALAGGLALLWRSPDSTRPWRSLARWTLVSLSTLVVLVPAIDFFYQLAQPRPGNPGSQILLLIAIPVLLLSLAIELLRVFMVRPGTVPVAVQQMPPEEQES